MTKIEKAVKEMTREEALQWYPFIKDTYANAAQGMAQVNAQLKQKPQDIQLMGMQKRLGHDLRELGRVINLIGYKLTKEIQSVTGIEFQFIVDDEKGGENGQALKVEK